MRPDDRLANPDSREAADVLVRHLFTPEVRGRIPGIAYGVEYRLAIGRSGGDIVDAFLLEDGSVSLVVADISGKGTRASVQAAVVKFSLRAFMSAGMGPGEALGRLDRLYRETNRFETSQSFATVFVARIDADRRTMTYASGGHEVVACKFPGQRARCLAVTAPAVGILSTYIVEKRSLEMPPGTLLVLATDGISESRKGDDFFGIEGFLEAVDRHAGQRVEEIARNIARDALAFSDRDAHDDVALLAARIDRL